MCMYVFGPGTIPIQQTHFYWMKAVVTDHIETFMIITLWLFKIAMENGPFIDDLPI